MKSRLSPASPRKILSPKPPLRRDYNRFDAIQDEYQLKSSKGHVKLDRQNQKGGVRVSQRQSPIKQLKRRLSFKKTMAPDENIQMKVQKQQIANKHIDKLQTNDELRLALQYNQLGQQSRGESKIKQHDREISPVQLRRLKRIRSNDFYQRKSTKIESLQKEDDSVLLKARRQNKNLKLLQLQSAKKIQELESQYAQQKIIFAKEQKFLQRKISVLKSKIESNKTQIGHLFTYQVFDQAKLIIKPIVEVEGESNITRSWMNSSEINELKQISKIYENQLNIQDKRELMTEATGPNSRESCGQLDAF